MRATLALTLLLAACASTTPTPHGESRKVLQRPAGAIAPPRAPSSPQRNWGAAQAGPSTKAMVFNWYPPEPLPSQLETERRYALWRDRPHERHHIFPQAQELYFRSKGIAVHDWTVIIDVAHHRALHKDGDGGPWNTEWLEWRRNTRGRATKVEHFDFARELIRKYNVFGIPVTYYQHLNLPPLPPP
ncbi:TIGR02269 family lipoprotein [Myxococcus sp. CA040A]|uniref:SitA6 family polymorphic toxin lipoprotein n=1 Tax=Myxococcus sp. CA040A TaxID=2741738 RepID=UPI00157A2CE7|nr:TIGR02269 family lipoprotein [Myxococcus sp. CA040A]NTX02411.1 TIGR02269 family lipoprotein [Myxococcus sp. CA040A]